MYYVAQGGMWLVSLDANGDAWFSMHVADAKKFRSAVTAAAVAKRLGAGAYVVS